MTPFPHPQPPLSCHAVLRDWSDRSPVGCWVWSPRSEFGKWQWGRVGQGGKKNKNKEGESRTRTRGQHSCVRNRLKAQELFQRVRHHGGEKGREGSPDPDSRAVGMSPRRLLVAVLGHHSSQKWACPSACHFPPP